jgi:hypothetical protein
MTATLQQETLPSQQRSGRQLVAFGSFWLSVMLLILAALLVVMKADRLIHWTKAAAEVQGAEVYSVIQRTGRSSIVWHAAVTIRYPVNGNPMVTTVDRGFQRYPVVDGTLGEAISGGIAQENPFQSCGSA